MVSGVAPPEPSAFATQMLKVPFVLRASLPSRAPWDEKAILLPSGDHAGKKLLPAVSFVTATAVPEPSAFITQTLVLLPGFAASLPSRAREDLKTILLPSGDHAGAKLPAPSAVSVVRAVAPEPSVLTTQMLLIAFVLAASLPSSARCELKAIFLPSGDQTGKKLLALAAVSLVSGVMPEPSASTTQILIVPLAFSASLKFKARRE